MTILLPHGVLFRGGEEDQIRKRLIEGNYIDSSGNTESWDIYASMFGGIPEKGIYELSKFWEAFPNLKGDLFTKLIIN